MGFLIRESLANLITLLSKFFGFFIANEEERLEEELMDEKEEENLEHLLTEDNIEELIKEDNVEELSIILDSNDNLRNNFNCFLSSLEIPLLHFAVQENSERVVEYLLSQDFVDKNITNYNDENIYHIICRIRGAEELFSIIERKVPHHLLLDNSKYGINAFHIACEKNNIFIVKRILETLQFNLTPIKTYAINWARQNNDIDVIKYVLSIVGILLNDDFSLLGVLGDSNIDLIVYLLNIFLCQSIPSQLHNQFHIFQFSDNHPIPFNNNNNNDDNYLKIVDKNILKDNNTQNEGEDEYNANRIHKSERDDRDDIFINSNNNNNNNNNINNNNNNNNKQDTNNNDYYLKLVEENFTKIIERVDEYGCGIVHFVSVNPNVDVFKLIFSLKGVQPDLLNEDGYNAYLSACAFNSNIKVIKYLHKIFPPFIHTQLYGSYFQFNSGVVKNGAFLVLENRKLEGARTLIDILHYLYLNGIDIHALTKYIFSPSFLESIYSNYISFYLLYRNYPGSYSNYDPKVVQYLKVISQDFDYQNNPHDDEA